MEHPTLERIRDKAKRKLKLLHNLKPSTSLPPEENVSLSTPSPSCGPMSKKKKFSSPLPANLAPVPPAVCKEVTEVRTCMAEKTKWLIASQAATRHSSDLSKSNTLDIQRMKVPVGLVEMEPPTSLIGQKTSVLIDRAPFKPTPTTDELASLVLPGSTKLLRALFLPAVYNVESGCQRAGLAILLDEPLTTNDGNWFAGINEMLHFPGTSKSEHTVEVLPDIRSQAVYFDRHALHMEDLTDDQGHAEVIETGAWKAYKRQVSEFRLACSSKEHMKAEVALWLRADGGLLELI